MNKFILLTGYDNYEVLVNSEEIVGVHYSMLNNKLFSAVIIKDTKNVFMVKQTPEQIYELIYAKNEHVPKLHELEEEGE